MSLSGALNAAQSGLAANQSLSRIAAGNISNALTPGYVRRLGVVTSQGNGSGGGVLVGEVRRDVDVALARVARQEIGKMTRQQAIYEGLQSYTAYLGQPDDERSPASRFSDFNTALTNLVNLPSSNGAHLGAVVAAEELAASIRGTSDFLSQVRAEVEMEIKYEIADLNRKLYDIAALNPVGTQLAPNSIEAVNHQDRIDGMIDDLSQIAEIRVTKTSDGWVNIYTTSGAALLEGDTVHDLIYNPSDGTFFAGSQEVTPAKVGVHGIENGSLAGFSELRNDVLPRFQLQLDEYARVLIQSFEDTDLSLNSAQAGLFTDNGSRFDLANLDGLANRLKVNDLVLASGSGQAWRVRDGLGAANPGDSSDTTQIHAFLEMFENTVTVDAKTELGSNLTIGNLAAELVAGQQSERARSELSFNSALSTAEIVQASRQNTEGVNIDDELQWLAMIEQSFAANSKIISVINEMFDSLMAAV